MSQWIVVVFNHPEEAENVRESVRKLEHAGQIKLDDAEVVVRDADGQVHTKGQASRGTKIGAVGGGLLGLLIAGIFFPIAGIALGALAGAGVGALAGTGIDKKFVNDVKEALKPGTSALFLVMREGNAAALVGALKPHEGTLYQTSLDPEDEETLRRVLSDGVGWSPEPPQGSEPPQEA